MRYRRPDSNPDRSTAIDYLRHLQEPLTIVDLSQKTGRHYNTIWRIWIPRLRQWGLIKTEGRKRIGPGNPHNTWTLTPRGREILGE